MERGVGVPGTRLVSGAEIENLPSFGMSNYVNLESGDETVAMLKKIQSGKYGSQREYSSNLLKPKAPTQTSSLVANDLPPPATTSNTDRPLQIYIQESQGEGQNDSATAPLSSTVDASQIMETEENSVQKSEDTGPYLDVKMMIDYMRFRYMSEKCPKTKTKGQKTRQYDADDSEKHCLAEVMIKNFDGTAKVIAYCVDQSGKLHPFNLYGEGCHRGVYVCRYKFRPGRPTLKLKKVSVTTPKASEYKENVKQQMAILSEAGIKDIKFCETVDDKQIVYVMFKAILEGYDGEILSQISTPLQNKKKGKEFLIDDVEPVSAPASGEVNCNVKRNRIMLHVTENTAFPSEVGLKIRERDVNGRTIWEKEPDTKDITVIKQCVVKFIPPPYKDPRTTEDVEVEICLYDKKTQKETDPFKFIYRGSEVKTKKRKLDEDMTMPASFESERFVRENRKFLSAIRTRPTSSGSSKSSGGSSPDITQNYMLEATGGEERDVSLRGQRSPTGNEGQGQQSTFSTGSSESALHPTRPESTGFSGETPEPLQPGSLNQSFHQFVTSATSVFGTTAPNATYQMTSMTAQPVPTNSMSYQSQQQLQQSQAAQSQTSQFTLLTEEDKLIMTQSGYRLPKLAKNQMIALVGGQIFVVNDDTAEEASNSAAISNQSAAGYQQVLVQPMAPQQPASEAEQRQASQTSNTAHGGLYQTKTTVNSSQAVGNLQYGAINSLNTTSAPQSATLQQQNLLQQQLQQQQQQQQQQTLQLLAQIAASAGLDINTPGVYESILQQINALQQQGSLQQEAQTSSAGGAGMFPSGSDLNDSDIEEDGNQFTANNKEDENSIIIEANQIPVCVNEVTIGDESNDSVSYTHVQSQKPADFKMKNGSFGNGIDSDDEEDS